MVKIPRVSRPKSSTALDLMVNSHVLLNFCENIHPLILPRNPRRPFSGTKVWHLPWAMHLSWTPIGYQQRVLLVPITSGYIDAVHGEASRWVHWCQNSINFIYLSSDGPRGPLAFSPWKCASGAQPFANGDSSRGDYSTGRAAQFPILEGWDHPTVSQIHPYPMIFFIIPLIINEYSSKNSLGSAGYCQKSTPNLKISLKIIISPY
jgi:hypothetical protein